MGTLSVFAQQRLTTGEAKLLDIAFVFRDDIVKSPMALTRFAHVITAGASGIDRAIVNRLVVAGKWIVLLLALSAGALAQDIDDTEVLWEQATVYRDEWGVPHVFAENARAMAFAFGYAQAEDHLKAMLFAYRVVNGRAAEVEGAPFSESDEFAIRMGHAQLAQQAFAKADTLTRDLCEGFSLGVNTWLFEHEEDAPEWAHSMKPSDVLALLHGYLMSQAPFDYEDAYRPYPGTQTANAWVVGPSASQSGETTLVMNPHTNYYDSYQWYEAHLETDDMKIYGATLFGLPVILQGYNDSLAWALSPNDPDNADLYMEPIDNFRMGNQGTLFAARQPGASGVPALPAETRSYYVKTDDGLYRRYLDRVHTSHGPVVARFEGRDLAYQVAGYGEFGALRQLYEMAKARDLREFQNALTHRQLPCFHIVYGDKEGNIYYLYNTKTGRRPRVEANPYRFRGTMAPHLENLVWDAPLDVGEQTYEWRGIIPFEELPSLLNPKSGFIQACGTPPWMVTRDSSIDPEDVPLWLARDADTYRAKRVRHLLSLGPRSFYDHQAMLYDIVAPFAVEAVPYLLELAEQEADYVAYAHPDLPEALEMLRDWNYVADLDSPAMTFFHVWWSVMLTIDLRTSRPTDELYALIQEDSVKIRWDALEAASTAARLTRNQYDRIDIPWGEIHLLYRGDRSVPMPGAMSGEPLFMTSDQDFGDDKWTVTSGYGFAMVVHFGATPGAVSLVPFGSSENPSSPHFDDQLDLMLERRFKLTRFERTDVERHAVSARGNGFLLRPKTASGITLYLRSASAVTASLRVAVENGPALPAGLSAFTPFVEPVVEPFDEPISVDIKVTIPESLCLQNNLGELGIFRYDALVGWINIPDQDLDWDARTFEARGYHTQVYAVLGPTAFKRGDLPVEDRRGVIPKPKGYESDKTRRRVRSQVAQAQTRPVEDAPQLNEALSDTLADAQGELNSAGAAEESVALPETEDLSGRAGVLASRAQGSQARGDDAENPLVARAQTLGAAEPLNTEASSILDGTGKVVWSNTTPSELRGSRSPNYESFYLAPNQKLASALVVGKMLELRPPVDNMLFVVRASKTIRAQAFILEPPLPELPVGLAAFCQIIEITYAPRNARGNTAISLRVSSQVCSPANFEDLTLYSFDEANGWVMVEGQKANRESMSFSALDRGMRTYAVLGPQEHRLGVPRAN